MSLPTSTRAARPSQPCPLGLWDWVWMGAVLLLLGVYSYARARNRIFWGDELNAYVLMQQKSFWAMMHNWRLSLDSGSLFYTSVGYWWVRIFSPPEIALRAFSAVGMGASFVLLWITARRFYPVIVVGACVPLAYMLNEFVRWQFYNGRMYGGFMAATALVIFALVKAAPGQPLTRRVLLLTFFAHLFLMSSHVLGLLYSGVFVAGLVAQDLWARSFRPRLYLSAAASWLVLIVSYANIKNTAALSKYGYFTQTPRLSDLINGTTVYSKGMLHIVCLLFASALLARLLTQKAMPQAERAPARTPVYFVLLCCAAILILAFGVSRFATSIFYNRYLLPVCLGDALLMCELLYWTITPLPRSRALRYVGVELASVLFVALYVRKFSLPFEFPVPDYTGAWMEKAPAGMPMVITDPGVFAELNHYHGEQRTMVIPLDWSVSTGPNSDSATATGTLQLERWQSGGIFAGHILSTDAILTGFPAFLALNTPEHSLWFQRYIKDNPGYDVVKEGTFGGQDFWIVRRRGSGGSFSPGT